MQTQVPPCECSVLVQGGEEAVAEAWWPDSVVWGLWAHQVAEGDVGLTVKGLCVS